MGLFDFMGMQGTYEERRVGRTNTEWGFISTAFVTDGVKPYETAVADSRYADPERGESSMVIVENYDTREEADKGHTKWCQTILADRDKLPLELVDCGNGLGGITGLLGIKYQLLPEL